MTDKNLVLGARIVAVMKNGPNWKDIPPEAEENWKPFIRQAPQVLSYLLDWPCSLSNLIEARMEWVTYLLREAAFRKVYQKDRLTSAVANFEDQLSKLDKFTHTPKAEQTSEVIEQFLRETFNLTRESLFSLCQKNVPLREVLLTQPWVILII